MEKLSSETYDVVLMDVQMPEHDCVETVKAIRAARGKFSKLPVIAMTAHAMLGDRERFLDAGMSDYIAKPIEEKQLLNVLTKWISVGATASSPAQSSALPEILPGLMIADGIRRTSATITKKMHEHLAANNLAAVSCFEELKLLAGANIDMKALEQSLDRLDFDAAREHLHVIERRLE